MTVQTELADKVAALCAAHGVKRLELFGSAARGDFDVHSSDVDFLVDFSDPNYVGAFDRYFGFKEALEKLLQRPVDLSHLHWHIGAIAYSLQSHLSWVLLYTDD